MWFKDTDDEEHRAEAAEEGTQRPHPAAILRWLSLIREPQLHPEVGQAHEEGQESAQQVHPHRHRLLKEGREGEKEGEREKGEGLFFIINAIRDREKRKNRKRAHEVIPGSCQE